MQAKYPNWDGTTPGRGSRHNTRDPNSLDWDALIEEVLAQQKAIKDSLNPDMPNIFCGQQEFKSTVILNGVCVYGVTSIILTKDENNFKPPIFTKRFRLNTNRTGSKNLTGLDLNPFMGQEITITNVSDLDDIVLVHESELSLDHNRFICTKERNIILQPNDEAIGWYDGVTERYRFRKI